MAELDEPVHLCPFHPEWPSVFSSEARRISAALPADVAIEHIGSTSVAGLLAKPIIDMMLGVEPGHNMDVVRGALTALGYEDMGEAGVPGRLYLRRRAETAFNAAIVARGGSIWAANLALREYLRANPGSAREYAETKRAAIENGAKSLLAYSDYKGPAVNQLIKRALGPKR